MISDGRKGGNRGRHIVDILIINKTLSIFSYDQIGWVMKLSTIGILLLILATILMLIFVSKQRQKDTIFTCTTYFDCPKRDSWAMFQKGMNGLLYDPYFLTRIDKIIVINEYSANQRANWGKIMKQMYPSVVFLQKGRTDAGQGRSFNMLMPHIKPYKYWLHWEESWYPSRPFLEEAFFIMDTDKSNITQLQFTKDEKGRTDWMTNNYDRRTHKSIDDINYCIIHPTEHIDRNQGYDKIKTAEEAVRYWPLYSLRPSLNRVAFYHNMQPFPENKFNPPLTAEYDYALKWYKKGGVKAVFANGPVTRSADYVSTHD